LKNVQEKYQEQIDVYECISIVYALHHVWSCPNYRVQHSYI